MDKKLNDLMLYQKKYQVGFDEVVNKLLDSPSILKNHTFKEVLIETELTPESGILDMTSRKWQDLNGKKQMEYAKDYQEWFAESLGLGLEKKVQLNEDVAVILRLIPPGVFLQGSNPIEPGRYETEDPVQIRIEEPYWMGRFLVTQGVWESVMHSNPSYFYGDPALPVDSVSLEEIFEFYSRTGLRLPNATLWEYAARAGSTKAFVFGNDVGQLLNYAWYNERESLAKDYVATLSTKPVGLKLPNAWGLYDVHGNVWEWCDSPFLPQQVKMPSKLKATFGNIVKMPKQNISLQLRGGDFLTNSEFCRLAYQNTSGFNVFLRGFRVWVPFEGEIRRLQHNKTSGA